MIYRYLRKYWRGGQTKNALLPDFDRRGAKGQERSVTHRKRGRPPKRILVEPEQIGVNVDAIIKEKLRRGAKLYYENAKARTLRDAYQLTLEHLFNRGFEKKGSLLVPVLPPMCELPTFGQFRYWYEKEHDTESAIRRKKGNRHFDLKVRPVLGDSTKMAQGPGAIYQIDATVADVYLVSSFNRSRIIGRPVVYIVEDVFCRMITGLYVGLEGPSWLGAMSAIENAASEKSA